MKTKYASPMRQLVLAALFLAPHEDFWNASADDSEALPEVQDDSYG